MDQLSSLLSALSSPTSPPSPQQTQQIQSYYTQPGFYSSLQQIARNRNERRESRVLAVSSCLGHLEAAALRGYQKEQPSSMEGSVALGGVVCDHEE
jgi:hypothetical protein